MPRDTAAFCAAHLSDGETSPKVGHPKLDVATQPSAADEADGSEQVCGKKGYR